MRRFFIEGHLEEELTLAGTEAHHILHVLRLQVGDEIRIVDASGLSGPGEIIALTMDSVKVRLRLIQQEEQEAHIQITLVQALPKADKMEWIVQKAVELGVAEIRSWHGEHSVVRYDERKCRQRVERWQAIAKEAAKQAQRTRIPLVHPIQSLAELLQQLPPHALPILLYEKEDKQGLKTILSHSEGTHFWLFVGPEGGISQEEYKMILNKGGESVSLGKRILRTETAPVAALAAILYHFDQLGG